ncbi:MAG: beta-ribofuranosylaminobenzene 5'-phosphate synthase family protein [Pseudomonadota bacterium]
MINISVPSRLHMTLIDLSATGYRRNGGIGFSIEEPNSSYLFSACAEINLSLLCEVGYDQAEIVSLSRKLQKIQVELGFTGICLAKVSAPARHSGLGTGTITALACIEAYYILNNHPVEPREIIFRSGRGGTSGIGIHSYFDGGFLFDVGRKFDNQEFRSSDDILKPDILPSIFLQQPMPRWPIGIFFPPGHDAVTRETERRLFAGVLPLTSEEVYKTTYHAVFGICAAVLDSDFEAFCEATNEIQQCTWKKSEVALHGTSLVNNINALKELGANAVGMSSVGPTLFFLAKNFSATMLRINQRFPEATVKCTFPSDIGRIISNG